MLFSSGRKKIKLLLFLFPLFSSSVFAANLSFSPAFGKVELGKSFTVSFSVTENSQAINGVAAKISYPSNLLRLNSLSKSDSILQMWSEEPGYSNKDGLAWVEGVILNPGFSGQKGLVLKANFTPIATGQAILSFVSGNVYANDGNATDLLSTLGKASYSIVESSRKGSVTLSDIPPPPQVKYPVVTSPTHPNEKIWYSSKDVLILTGMEGDAAAMNYSFGKDKTKSENIIDKPTPTLTFSPQNDGIYLVRLKQKVGKVWSQDSVFSVHVDDTAPYNVFATLPYGTSSSKMFQQVTLSAKDAVSGISRFDVSLNKGTTITVEADASGNAVLDLPKAIPGENILEVLAYDKANNITKITELFRVTLLDAPTVSAMTDTIKSGEAIHLEAKTYPNAKLVLTLKNNKDSIETSYESNELGDLALSTIFTKPGIYNAYIKLENYEGGESEMKSIGTVRIKYSFAQISALFDRENIILFIIAIVLVVTSSAITYSVTRRSILKTTNVSRKSFKDIFSRWLVKSKELFKEIEKP